MKLPAVPEGFDIRIGDVLAAVRTNIPLVLLCTGAMFVTVLVGTLFSTPQYKSTALLELVARSPQELDVAEVIKNDVRSFQEIERFYRTQLQIIKTRSIAEDVLRRYARLGYQDLDPDTSVERLRRSLTVFPRERSQLIEITIVSDDPERAAVLANLYAKAYVEGNLEARRDASRAAKEWLESKIVEYQATVQQASTSMLDYKGAVDLADAEERVTTLSQRLVTLDQSYGAVTTEQVLLQTEIEANRRMIETRRYAELAQVLDTPLLRALAESYADAWTEHATLAARYGEKHPELKVSQARLDRISAQLADQVRRTVAAQTAQLELLQSKEASLFAAIEETKDALLDQQRKQAEYARLRLEYQRSEQFLKRLSERSDELDLAARTQLNNARIIEEARPPKRPFKPRVFLNLGLALFTGTLAGVALAFLRYWADDTIKSPLEITAHFDLPFLGAITRATPTEMGEHGELITYHKPESVMAEAARGVWTLMRFRDAEVPLRRILVTSSFASEGKTATCVRLGIAGSQFGQRVVIIDVDHRRARLHKVFGNDNAIGLTSFLSGRASAAEIAIPTEVPGLSMVPIGPKLDDVGQLLVSPLMEDLLGQLEERFDLIILDTPPSAGLTEPVNLSRMVDGVVFVIRAGGVSRDTVRHALDRFRHVKATLIGAVLNVVDRDAGIGGYYGYRYYQYYTNTHDADPKDAAAK